MQPHAVGDDLRRVAVALVTPRLRPPVLAATSQLTSLAVPSRVSDAVLSRMRQRTQSARTTPRMISAVISSAHQTVWCDHSVSLVCSSGAMVPKSVVDEEAANPQRAGITQDSWSRPVRPVTGIIPPQNTIDSITEITSIGRI